MSSNNPFSTILNDTKTFRHREAPPIPGRNIITTPPIRPQKPELISSISYEKLKRAEKPRGDHKRNKQERISSRHTSSSRTHHSHSSSHRLHHSQNDKEKKHHKSSSSKPEPVKAKNLDAIDKLDVTAFFGGGFHHDGPFDACTPHRNKNVKAAPVMAFPADGPNNSIKGLDDRIYKDKQMDLAFGNFDEESQDEIPGRKAIIRKQLPCNDLIPFIKTNRNNDDLSTTLYTPKENPSVINFDANVKATPIHGSTTAGLGSSTFIDGAPAPKYAVKDEYLNAFNSGVGRKKSIVARLRKNSNENSRRNLIEINIENNKAEERKISIGNVTSDSELITTNNGGNSSSLLSRVKSLKVRRQDDKKTTK